MMLWNYRKFLGLLEISACQDGNMDHLQKDGVDQTKWKISLFQSFSTYINTHQPAATYILLELEQYICQKRDYLDALDRRPSSCAQVHLRQLTRWHSARCCVPSTSSVQPSHGSYPQLWWKALRCINVTFYRRLLRIGHPTPSRYRYGWYVFQGITERCSLFCVFHHLYSISHGWVTYAEHQRPTAKVIWNGIML